MFVIPFNILLDSFLHGKFLVSWFNFFLYNVYHNIGTHYGTHPWYWYIVQGYPTILCSHTVVFVIGLFHTRKSVLPIATITFNIVIYR